MPNPAPVLRLGLIALATLAGILPPGDGHAAAHVRNQAFGSYYDEAQARVRDLVSNPVITAVTLSPGLSLQASQTRQADPGRTVVFAHDLTNTGGATGTYRVTVGAVGSALGAESQAVMAGGPPAFIPETITLYDDSNGNQRLDPGEPVLPSGVVLTLEPGTVRRLLVSGRVPTDAQDGASGQLEIAATELNTGQFAVNVNTITVTQSQVQLLKSVDRSQTRPGEEVVWTLTLTTGTGTLDPVTATIDGTSQQRVILRDIIPPNSVFSEFRHASQGTPLYHLHGSPLHQYQTVPPTDPSMVSAVAWAFAAIGPHSGIEVSFATRLTEWASGPILNTGSLYFRRAGTAELQASNEALVLSPIAPPGIGYFTGADFTIPAPLTRIGRPLFISAYAPTCNLDPLVVETITITITSALTGDVERVTAIETGPNTGVFRVDPPQLTADATEQPAVPINGILETLPFDTLTARIEDCVGLASSATIVMDPAGVVFDSRTNAPIAGARVTLVDVTGQGNGGRPGQPAAVFEEDALTPSPATVITAADGVFRFPLVRQSTYRFEVEPPANYAFPSVVPPNLLPSGRRILQGSYGDSLQVPEPTGAVFLDIPLDPATGAGFLLRKEVNREVAELGDSVTYTIELRNVTGADLLGVVVEDRLPPGFRYEKGTFRRNGQSAGDPTGGAGPDLRFNLGRVAQGVTETLTYRVRLGPGSDRGDGINRARAVSAGPPLLHSNQAQAIVRVEPGVFSDHAVILGTVFLDLNGNGRHDEGEPGVPGVRVYLANGSLAVTDSAGRYSFYGLPPVTQVVRLDELTLPAAAVPAIGDPRFAGRPNSRFADLRPGELHRANFPLRAVDERAEAEVRRRQAAAARPLNELESALDTPFRTEARPHLMVDKGTAPAAGMLRGTAPARERTSPSVPARSAPGLQAGDPAPADLPGPAHPRRGADGLLDLEGYLVKHPDPSPRIIWPPEGVVKRRSSDLVVTGRQGAVLSLWVNGREVPQQRIGRWVQHPGFGLQAVEYIAVALRAGENEVEVRQTDPFGNPRGSQTLRLLAPGDLGRLRITPAADPVADGGTPMIVRIHTEDLSGVPITGRQPITLEAEAGRWLVRDLDPAEPGVQSFIEGGVGEFELLPPFQPGPERLRVTSGTVQAEQRFDYLPAIRPWLMVGVAEGRIDQGGSAQRNPLLATDQAGELSRLGSIHGHEAEGRTAFYLQGNLGPETLLTASYDSAKDRDAVLFRDIEPDAYFPIYGDSGGRGFDAQSSDRWYGRIDHQRHSLLFGDFSTRTTDSSQTLSSSSRSLTGARGRYETDPIGATLWGAETSSRQMVQELPANGTSGPFDFRAAQGRLNSETVEILTRDRNQPGVVLQARTLRRFSDYEFEPFSGRLLLRAPVASFDPDLNPQSIRITYESETGGPAHWVYGGSLRWTPFEAIRLGASWQRADDPVQREELAGLFGRWQVSAGHALTAEIARSDAEGIGDAQAWRVEWSIEDVRTRGRLYYGKADPDFVNPIALLSSGRREGGIELTHRLDADWQTRLQGVFTEDARFGGSRQGLKVDFIREIAPGWRMTVGGRISEESEQPADASTVGIAPNDVLSVSARVDAPVPKLPAARAFIEWENDVRETDRRRIVMGSDYRFGPRTRTYVRHDLTDSLGGEFALNSMQSTHRTLAGIESEYRPGQHTFNEYRVREGISGREAEAATGLRSQWNMPSGLRLGGTFERITPMSSGERGPATSVTTSLGFTETDLWTTNARLEFRFGENSDTVLATLGYARRLSESWSFLTRGALYDVNSSSAAAADSLQIRWLTGIAVRPREFKDWSALIRHEWRYEDGSLELAERDLQRTVNAVHALTHWEPRHRLHLNGRWAAKWVSEHRPTDHTRYTAQLVGARIRQEMGERLDVGAGVSHWWGSGGTRQWAWGPELGCTLMRDWRLGLGYRFAGFEDRDLMSPSETHRGWYITLRIKFDETLLDRFFRRPRQHAEGPL